MNIRTLLFIPLLAMLWAFPVHAEETSLIKYSGSPIAEPHWFKDSFLELADDISEADEEGKKLIIYFHQAGCPYCYNLVQQSLLDPALSQYIQEHFDILALDLWGDREVTLPNGQVFSEKELAIHWKIQYTPTLLFFAEKPEPVLRIDGYRSKAMLAKIFDYVVTGDTKSSLAQRLIQEEQGSEATLYPSVDFSFTKQFDQIESGKPLAILFEYPGCADCDQLHRNVLTRRDTHQLLQHFTALRVDLSDDTSLTTPQGTVITAKQWAAELGLTYFPSVILLDEKQEERFRIDAYVQAYHFNTALDYVRLKKHLEFPEFQRYVNERADQLRAAGKKVVITD